MRRLVTVISGGLSVLFLVLWQFDFADSLIRLPFTINGNSFAGIFFDWISFFPVLFVFSLIVSVNKNNLFDAWWKFAKIATPMILSISLILLIGFHHTPGGFINLEDQIDRVAILFMYAIFSLTSLWIIARSYWRQR